MVLCGNICFSGFYSDDFHVQGAEWGERLSKRTSNNEHPEVFAAQSATWLDLENKSFAKKIRKKYEFTMLLVIFQSRSSSLM